MTKQSKKDKIIIDTQASLINEKENLIENMKSQFDIYVTEVAEIKEKCFIYKNYIKNLSIVCVIFAITLIVKLFVF